MSVTEYIENNNIMKITTPDLESMKERLANNDAENYANGFSIEALYRILKKGIKGYDNMTKQEILKIHKDVFGFVDYKLV